MSGRSAFRRIYPQPKRAVSFKRARSQARVYATYASAQNTNRTGSIIFNSRVELTRTTDEHKSDVIGERKLGSMPDFMPRYAADSTTATKESVFMSKMFFRRSFYLFKTIVTDCCCKLSSRRKNVIVHTQDL